ncbi:MAG: NAD(P)-dependent oxidoreductase [Candidatus Bathyarchaeia archaeon]
MSNMASSSIEELNSELLVGLIFAFARGIMKADSSMKEGKWLKKELIGFELSGKTLGIIGLSITGNSLAKKAHLLGMSVIATSNGKKNKFVPEEFVKFVSLDELLKKSDFIYIDDSLSSEEFILNSDKLKLIKNTAYIINMGEKSLIEWNSLLNALRNMEIAGMAFNKDEVDPKFFDELIKLPHTIFFIKNKK